MTEFVYGDLNNASDEVLLKIIAPIHEVVNEFNLSILNSLIWEIIVQYIPIRYWPTLLQDYLDHLSSAYSMVVVLYFKIK